MSWDTCVTSILCTFSVFIASIIMAALLIEADVLNMIGPEFDCLIGGTTNNNGTLTTDWCTYSDSVNCGWIDCPVQCHNLECPDNCETVICPIECDTITCPDNCGDVICLDEFPDVCETVTCPDECTSLECPDECATLECPDECKYLTCPDICRSGECFGECGTVTGFCSDDGCVSNWLGEWNNGTSKPCWMESNGNVTWDNDVYPWYAWVGIWIAMVVISIVCVFGCYVKFNGWPCHRDSKCGRCVNKVSPALV